jgi:hypothetical protein
MPASRTRRGDRPAPPPAGGGAARTETLIEAVVRAVPGSWDVPATTIRAVSVRELPGCAPGGRFPETSSRPDAPASRVPVQVTARRSQRNPDAPPPT